MNNKAKTLLKNLNYTVSANLLAFIVSATLSMFVPKFIGIEEYGLWQIYVFYSSYISLFQLGWMEGIYLKIGGEEYENLDKSNLGSQFWYFLIFQIAIGSLVILYSLFFINSGNKVFILSNVGIVMIISNIKLYCIYILQSTNRIKEYAMLSRNDRYMYAILVLTYLLFGGENFKYLILFDILSKLVVTSWGVYRIRDLVFTKIDNIQNVFIEIKDNIKIGSNLMLASIANLLILGTTKFFVERTWSVEIFGSLSFALSVSNMFMLLVNSVGTVLYPMLRRAKSSDLPKMYLEVRALFVPLLFGLLLLYYPARIILLWWLPEYELSLTYMGVLFPMLVYEGRVSLLTNTYMKTIRRERTILILNTMTWLLSILLSVVSILILNSIELAVVSIVISLFFRCVISEEVLMRILSISLGKANIIEMILTITFVLSNLVISPLKSWVLYFLIYLIFLLSRKKSMINSFQYFKNLYKK